MSYSEYPKIIYLRDANECFELSQDFRDLKICLHQFFLPRTRFGGGASMVKINTKGKPFFIAILEPKIL